MAFSSAHTSSAVHTRPRGTALATHTNVIPFQYQYTPEYEHKKMALRQCIILPTTKAGELGEAYGAATVAVLTLSMTISTHIVSVTLSMQAT